MNTALTRERALEALKKYNREPFHILHALTVEGVMRWFAQDQGYGEETDFWGIAGLLHDIDFEMYPEQHCVKAPELLKEAGAEDELIHAVCSHGYGLVSDVKPEHQMEKILFASDELTGLIGCPDPVPDAGGNLKNLGKGKAYRHIRHQQYRGSLLSGRQNYPSQRLPGHCKGGISHQYTEAKGYGKRGIPEAAYGYFRQH